jgi:hypothetical protein
MHLSACDDDVYMYMYVAIHALASMPSALRLSKADSKVSTIGVIMYVRDKQRHRIIEARHLVVYLSCFPSLQV